MATTEKLKYAAAASIICSVASLASGASRQSTEVDNTTDLFVDVVLGLSLKLATGTPGDESAIKIWFYGNVDNIRDGGATGTDGAYTLENPSLLRGPVVLPVTATGDAATWSATISVAEQFGGTLPSKWGYVVNNRTNLAFDATGSTHLQRYIGVHGQSL